MKKGIFVVFEGTDGSGKTTIINNLPQALNIHKSNISYYHWRPGFIMKEKKNKDGSVMICTEPHAKKPYGKIKSFAKFMFFNLDYILGYWLKIRIELNRGKFVIFDRYYYDYYLDKIRYRLTISDKVLNIFKVIIPQPDITFLLIGDPVALYERKKEISISEIQQQIYRLIRNKDNFANSVVIDVNQNVELVIKDVAKNLRKYTA